MITPALGALALAINGEGGRDGRQWVQLIPAGPDVVGRDGRRWTMPDPHAVLSATRAENKPLAVDWEHASIVRADAGLDAPASGWIEGLEVRAGSIWGRSPGPRGLGTKSPTANTGSSRRCSPSTE